MLLDASCCHQNVQFKPDQLKNLSYHTGYWYAMITSTFPIPVISRELILTRDFLISSLKQLWFWILACSTWKKGQPWMAIGTAGASDCICGRGPVLHLGDTFREPVKCREFDPPLVVKDIGQRYCWLIVHWCSLAIERAWHRSPGSPSFSEKCAAHACTYTHTHIHIATMCIVS